MKIILKEIYNNTITSRKSVTDIFTNEIPKESKSVIFDFTDIEIISRSAAHEYNFRKKLLQNLNIDVTEKNVKSNVQNMLDLTRNNRKYSSAVALNLKSFKNQHEFAGYLNTL